jgi:hypothetical protein
MKPIFNDNFSGKMILTKGNKSSKPKSNKLSTPKVKYNIMVDPSVFLSSDKSNKLFNIIDNLYKEKFKKYKVNIYIPAAFYDCVMQKTNIDEITDFYSEIDSIDWDLLKNNLLLYGNKIKKYTVKPNLKAKYKSFVNKLNSLDNEIPEILFQELVFLNEMSVIASISRKLFDVFIDIGASVIQITKDFVDDKVKHFINKTDDDSIIWDEYLLAFFKWIAVIGVPFMVPMPFPLNFIPSGGLTFLFWLIDP